MPECVWVSFGLESNCGDVVVMSHSQCFVFPSGRRLAELELHIALAHLVREYKMDFLDDKPMGYIQNFLVKPERQLDLTFKKL